MVVVGTATRVASVWVSGLLEQRLSRLGDFWKIIAGQGVGRES